MDRPWLALAIENKLSDLWHNLDRKVIELALKAMWEIIQKELLKWNEVHLYNFAKFSVSQRKQRNWINPSLMKPMIIPAHKTIKFTACKSFKKKVHSI